MLLQDWRLQILKTPAALAECGETGRIGIWKKKQTFGRGSEYIDHAVYLSNGSIINFTQW